MPNNKTLLRRSYAGVRSAVNVGLALAVAAGIGHGPLAGAQQPAGDWENCTPGLRQRFAPPDPDSADTYAVCRSTRPIRALADPGWLAAESVVDDAFAGVAPAVRRALALLYRGRRVEVIRGWRTMNGELSAVTLISPPPDDSLTHLTDGTLIIRARIRR